MAHFTKYIDQFYILETHWQWKITVLCIIGILHQTINNVLLQVLPENLLSLCNGFGKLVGSKVEANGSD